MRATCLKQVHALAKRDERVVFIGSDLSPGLLADMKREMPERWFMEGITEQNVVGMAAGFAMEGFIPYVNTIATFITRRCYEQVAVDLCLHDLPVRLIGNGGGLVYAPLGPTHLAIEDIAIMRALPNMAVVAVCDAQGLIGREMFAIDGVKLPRNASKHRSGTRAEFERQAAKLEAAATVMLERHHAADTAPPEPDGATKAAHRIERLERDAAQRRAWLPMHPDDPRGTNGSVRKNNRTDNESAKMATSNGVIHGLHGGHCR